MNERIPCEFFLIRYVPDVVKGEFTNIGVLIREAAQPESARVRFTRDWSRVRCVDADADIGLLEALEGEIERMIMLGAKALNPIYPRPILALIEESFSNSVQMTEARACLAESVIAELEQLMRMYVEPLRARAERRRTGRAAIAGAMRTEFECAGVWTLMRKRISASLYTRAGDPMKIDCGYRPNGVIKMFHAVSLEADVEAAKVLAYSAPQLFEGVARVEGGRLELTAVVEPLRAVSRQSSKDFEINVNETDETDNDEAIDRYRFGVEAMERQAIRVVTLNDLARAAQTARQDLHL